MNSADKWQYSLLKMYILLKLNNIFLARQYF